MAAKEPDIELGLVNSSAGPVNGPDPVRPGEASGTRVVRSDQNLPLGYIC